MNRKGLLQQTFVFLTLLGLLAACNSASDQTSTITSSKNPFNVNSFELQIISVNLGASMFDPTGIAKDETVLTVEIKVLSGDPKTVAKTDCEFDVWVTDDTGKKNSSRAGTAMTNKDGKIKSIKWLFGVPKDSKLFYLHFPSRVKVDLSELFP